MKILETYIVRVFLAIKSALGVQAWVLESTFVLTLLLLTALVSGKGWVEYLAVVAVFLTFKHASVSERLREANDANARRATAETTICAHKLQRFFYGKEIAWVMYFLLIGAYSALAGCAIFFLYGWWRAAYRRVHPRESKPYLRQFFRHFKYQDDEGIAGCYEVTGLREFTETGEIHVDYRPCYKRPNIVKTKGLSRTYANLFGPVIKDGTVVADKRFRAITDREMIQLCINETDKLYE